MKTLNIVLFLGCGFLLYSIREALNFYDLYYLVLGLALGHFAKMLNINLLLFMVLSTLFFFLIPTSEYTKYKADLAEFLAFGISFFICKTIFKPYAKR